jgi:hypothetical protein
LHQFIEAVVERLAGHLRERSPEEEWLSRKEEVSALSMFGQRVDV